MSEAMTVVREHALNPEKPPVSELETSVRAFDLWQRSERLANPTPDLLRRFHGHVKLRLQQGSDA